ncbi:T9SS type A sorting domain-containing protein [Formosa sediminum]|uniref:T9SS type A sorting domain-containing protein n=1 Tax=Formosa sediminum TaxID=2594004 RepID=A0A516GR19_9FLAO|nr:chondroitinase-B domain-containing protein [Formosa sediminum]QDO93977.1 T9SS type A sorting domain-containing protein [Formosa sediminum]
MTITQVTNYVFAFALLFTASSYGQVVSTTTQLESALANATPGSTITLANKTWTNVELSINKSGTQDQPIIIEAQTSGSVFFEGNSHVKLGGKYIIFKGIVFQNASNIDTDTPVIEFKSAQDCNYCTVTDIKIDAYNGTNAQEKETFKWILLRGTHNEVSYSSFIGKHGVGSIINDNRSSTEANYHKIHHNYFADRTPVGEINDLNDQDAIRLGSSSTSLSDSYSEVYNNYFYNFSGEIEVISNKSGKNKYYNNTFEDYQGALTLRHGNGCEVYNNFFFANKNVFSGGIRVMGENHNIYNNYIEGVNSKKPDGSTSGGTGGINVSNGKPDSSLNEYYQVKNVNIVNNTFVDCDYGLRIGTKIKSTNTLAPENVIVANNLIYENTVKAIQVITELIGTLSKFEGNIKQNGTWDIDTDADGNISVTSGLLSSQDNFYRIVAGSDAVNAGKGSYSFLTEDILGGIRPSNFDVGAEELNAGGVSFPYSQLDVGVTVGFGGKSTLGIGEASIQDTKLLIYPLPSKSDYINVSLGNRILGTVEIADMSGRIVLKTYCNTTKAELLVSTLKTGTYIVKVQDVSKKIVIK